MAKHHVNTQSCVWGEACEALASGPPRGVSRANFSHFLWKTDPNIIYSEADHKYSALKRASNSNCNVKVLCFQGPPNSNSSVLCIMNTLLHFLLCQSCRSLRNVSLAGLHIPFLGLIKRSYHGDWVWWSHPFFSLASGPPTLSPPLWIPFSFAERSTDTESRDCQGEVSTFVE